MDIATAKTAGEIAAALERRYAMRDVVTQAISEGWLICDVRANGGSGSVSLVLDTLDAETSELALQYVKGIYDAQIAALETDLTEMS